MSIHPNVRSALEEVKRREIHGATLITRLALDALSEAAVGSKARSTEEFFKELSEQGSLLVKSRPTSVLLANGIRHVLYHVKMGVEKGQPIKELKNIAKDRVEEFLRELNDSIEKIGQVGARRLGKNDVILTHGYSTSALEVLRKGREEGKNIKVIVTETRPEYQGRLMARELVRIGIPTTIIIDSAIHNFMREVDKVLVGAEAVAANGAIVNKIGTSTIALAAHESRVRVFVAAGIYKFSPETMLGELIEIEERDPFLVVPEEELQKIGQVGVRNPAFDVTPPEHIDLIITERGVIPPQGAIIILRERRAIPIFS